MSCLHINQNCTSFLNPPLPLSIKLSKSDIESINTFLEQYLERLVKIKVLRNQLKEIVPCDVECIDMDYFDTDHLPQLKFIIYLITSMECNTKELKSIFNGCNIIENELSIVITGHIPAEEKAYNARPVLFTKRNQPTPKKEMKPLASDHSSDNKTQVAERKAKSNPAATPSPLLSSGKEKPALSSGSSSAKMLLKWKSAVFNEDDKQCSVKRLESKVFHDHYVTCQLSPDPFPPGMFKTAKEKIEAGRLANAKTGAVGLQFREERLGQNTVSYMRLKLLGAKGKGDLRCYAEREEITGQNNEKAYLYVFKYMSNHAH